MPLIDTIRNSVLNVVILLTMLMAFFAVVGYYIFGYDEETGDKENWGTLSTAMLTPALLKHGSRVKGKGQG